MYYSKEKVKRTGERTTCSRHSINGLPCLHGNNHFMTFAIFTSSNVFDIINNSPGREVSCKVKHGTLLQSNEWVWIPDMVIEDHKKKNCRGPQEAK
ncbi:hypothetical protein P4O66_000282 [Electrophorus voltai]|uniref:Uncharacterized protein n=1 Tax=Electrophorus voltai TaxID=2609070 RepID=A0AAD9DZZ6_9TELE|nr:hypothetical protein P4O66_000282 [Electrophorus voltai]